MTVCKFFMQGYCKYGESCRFEHQSGGNAGYAYSAQRQLFGGGSRGGGQSFGGGGRGGGQSYSGGNRGGGNRFQQNNPYKWQASENKPVTAQMSTNDLINTLISEISEWESNNMWPFSCVAFEKECPCIPDFTDTSPEELRTAAYEALKSGSLQSYIQQVQTLTEEYKQKRLQVKNLNVTMKQRLISLIEDYRLNKTKSSSSTAGSVSLFSKSGNTTFGATGSSNPFASAGTGSSNVFGATGTSAFGASSTPSTAFGASGQAFGATSSSFGSTTFGTSSQTQGVENKTFAGFSGSTFGSQSGTSPLNFGAETNQTVSAFGQGSNNTAAGFPTVQTGFGSSTFGNQSQTVGPSTFGNQSQTTGLFGKPAASPAANLFGSLSSQSPNASSLQAGNATSTGFQVFGASSPGFSSAGASSDTDLKKYTPLDQLTPEELEAFQAPTFTLGRIPTRPPPKELVF